MTPVRLLTIDLIALLTDLAHTTAADAFLAGTNCILLHSARGYLGNEPGTTGLLAGTSTTGITIGHTSVEAGGNLPPMMWPLADAKAVIASFKPLTKDNKEHVTEIRIAADGKIEVCEDPDLFGNGLTLSFGPGNLDDFPRGVWSVLSDVRLTPPTDSPVAPRTDYPAGALAPFMAVAKRRNAFMQTYRYHQRTPVLVQIGEGYRGALMPASWDEQAHEGVEPGGDIYAADLPPLPEPKQTDAELATVGPNGDQNG